MADFPDRVVVFIATPLDDDQVERIRDVDRERVTVIFEPDLLPPRRYSIDHIGQPEFQRTAEQEERWRANLERAEALWDFPPDSPDGTRGLDLARNLRWLQTTSSGIGPRVRRYGLDRSDVIVTNAAGVHAAPLTEFVFLTLLLHSRRLLRLQQDQRDRRWERFTGDEWEGKTLAMVGLGGVGRRIVTTARHFGMRVVGLTRAGSDRTAEASGVDALFGPDRFHDMLGIADALVLCVPHTADTEGLMDRAAFSALKPGAVFVNIARGAVVDEAALIDALREHRIAFAGLDVFATEPLPTDSPLWELDNVLISPHSSANADSENRRITDLFCHNLRCLLDRRPEEMRNVFDKEKMY